MRWLVRREWPPCRRRRLRRRVAETRLQVLEPELRRPQVEGPLVPVPPYPRREEHPRRQLLVLKVFVYERKKPFCAACTPRNGTKIVLTWDSRCARELFLNAKLLLYLYAFVLCRRPARPPGLSPSSSVYVRAITSSSCPGVRPSGRAVALVGGLLPSPVPPVQVVAGQAGRATGPRAGDASVAGRPVTSGLGPTPGHAQGPALGPPALVALLLDVLDAAQTGVGPVVAAPPCHREADGTRQAVARRPGREGVAVRPFLGRAAPVYGPRPAVALDALTLAGPRRTAPPAVLGLFCHIYAVSGRHLHTIRGRLVASPSTPYLHLLENLW